MAAWIYVQRGNGSFMRIINSADYKLNNDSAVTIGKFDGVHRGHRLLLDRIIEKKSEGLEAVVFTFDPSPMEFFSGKIIPGLTTREEKRRIFKYLGVDTLIEFPLNAETAAIDPVDYITNILCKQTRMKYIAAGDDATFGNRGMGNAKLLTEYADKCGYEAEIINKLVIDGTEVGSTLVRDVVMSGDMERAEKLIGVPYAVYGTVCHGRALARKMGFPTVNIEISRDKLMPPFGVYFAQISIDGKHYNGITNIGCKPTVTSDKTVFAETNIFDFDENVYDKTITVKLKHFHRPEMKFASIDELSEHIADDTAAARNFFIV